MNKVDRHGNTPLHLACSHGYEEVSASPTSIFISLTHVDLYFDLYFNCNFFPFLFISVRERPNISHID